MNMATVKKDSEIKLDGVTVEVTRKDGGAVAVTVRDCVGGVLLVQLGQYGGLDVMVPAPPEKVTRWEVTGKIKGIAFRELFKEEYKALGRIGDFNDMDGVIVEMKKVTVDESDDATPTVSKPDVEPAL